MLGLKKDNDDGSHPSWQVLFPYVILFAVTDMLMKTYKKKIEAQKYKFMM